jgi:hypothetical protein
MLLSKTRADMIVMSLTDLLCSSCLDCFSWLVFSPVVVLVEVLAVV